jgi:predicted nucleic acid-binding protein
MSAGKSASVELEARFQGTALDTSVILAGLLGWHERHRVASAVLSSLLESEGRIVLPLQSLVEAYSVMTRLPAPHRLSPGSALRILEGSLRGRVIVVGLEGDEGWRCLEDLVRSSIAGGTSYDGLILACARKGDAKRILTFNPAHFERLGIEGIEGIEVVVPGRATES